MPEKLQKTNRADVSDCLDRLATLAPSEWASEYIKAHKWRCFDDIRRVSTLRRTAKILNLGGAPYIFEVLAQLEGHTTLSIDIHPDRNKSIINAFKLDVKNIDFEIDEDRNKINIEEFDIVCMCEVFEHMRIDLVKTMKDISRRMRNDAIIYLTTPNFFFARRLLHRIFSGRSGPPLNSEWSKIELLGHMGHVREYSQVELTEFFEYVGLRVEDIVVRNRSNWLAHSPLWFLPSLLLGLVERSCNLLGEDLIFTLTRRN